MFGSQLFHLLLLSPHTKLQKPAWHLSSPGNSICMTRHRNRPILSCIHLYGIAQVFQTFSDLFCIASSTPPPHQDHDYSCCQAHTAAKCEPYPSILKVWQWYLHHSWRNAVCPTWQNCSTHGVMHTTVALVPSVPFERCMITCPEGREGRNTDSTGGEGVLEQELTYGCGRDDRRDIS